MKINVPFKKLKHIVHIADVHIRLFQRHEEYELAFQTLYDDIKAKNLTDFVIYLAGDIAHSKTDISPEMIQVTSNFLSKIADIAPTIMIAGNHDCNLSNLNRLDALTPIVDSLKHPNLHYLRDTTTAYLADTAFVVFSILDNPENWPTADQINSNVTNKIVLYHGPIQGAMTDSNHAITDSHININKFDGFDLALLGDIHRHQILQEYDSLNKKPIVAYASSLIQQNHGELIDGHGWCLWDIPTKTVEFNSLKNDYCFSTIEVVNGVMTYPTTMSKNVRARIFYQNTTLLETKRLVEILHQQYNFLDKKFAPKKNYSHDPKHSVMPHHDVLDLTNVSVQNQLIQDWILRNQLNINTNVLGAINKINREINTKISHEDYSRSIRWRPLKFKFDNMFSYGERNEINFENLNGLYGIFAPNASGKSSIMDALMFCLYDKTSRAFKGDHIINNRKDTFFCELTFQINNEVFGIKRSGTRKKSGDVKVDVEFWKWVEGVPVTLNGEDRRDTNAIIRSYIGSYEDFVMTAMSGQQGTSMFVDKSHAERKDLLIQFMGLNIFDKLFDAAHEENKEIAGILKRFKKSDVTDQLTEIQQSLIKVTDRIEEFESGKETFTQTLLEIENQYKQKYATKRPVPETSGNWSDLQNRLTTTEKKLKTAQEDVAIAEYALISSETDLKEVVTEFSNYDMAALKVSFDKWNELNELLKKKNNSIRILNTKIQEKTVFKTKLEAYKYNPNCDVCVENNRSVIEDVKLVNEELDNLHAERIIEEDAVRTVISECDEHAWNKDSYEEALLLQKELVELGQAVEKSKNVLATAKNTLEKVEILLGKIHDEISVYKTNEENILHNQTVEKELQVIHRNIADTKQNIANIDRELRLLHGDISVLNAKNDELTNKLKEIEQFELSHEAYKYYMTAVNRDGIPYELISKAIPSIQAEINNILAQLVKFEVSLEVDGKNINSKLTYDNDRVWPLENGSGMERFISSLAIRVALMNASNLPKPNFIMIDEGFGVLDKENLHSMQILFNLLKTHFDFILIISHLDTARDMVDSVIEIENSNGFSKILV